MSLIRWTPTLDPFEEMERAIESFSPMSTKSLIKNFIPSIDVYETESNVVIEASLAGIDPEKVEISVENGTLYIKGKTEQKSEVDDKNYYRREVRKGSFYRSVILPTSINEEKISAEYEKGVLKIIAPKIKETKSKIIKVQIKDKS